MGRSMISWALEALETPSTKMEPSLVGVMRAHVASKSRTRGHEPIFRLENLLAVTLWYGVMSATLQSQTTMQGSYAR
jgi:hypothetical protein